MNQPHATLAGTTVDCPDCRALRDLLMERDRRVSGEFSVMDERMKQAVASLKELNSAAFAASEKAIGKAEQAQSEYNIRSNEFRGQLDDQAKMLMPRSETESTFSTHRELIDRAREEARGNTELLRKEVIALQQEASKYRGRADYSIPLIMLAVSVMVGLVVFFIQRAMGP